LWVALFYASVWYTIVKCAFEVHEENRGWQNEGIMGDCILGNRDRNNSHQSLATCKILVVKPGNKAFEWYNIKMNLKETGCDGMG
jgi:hypothetical protein